MDCGYPRGLWIPTWIVDTHVDCGYPRGLWIPTWIVDTPDCGYPPDPHFHMTHVKCLVRQPRSTFSYDACQLFSKTILGYYIRPESTGSAQFTFDTRRVHIAVLLPQLTKLHCNMHIQVQMVKTVAEHVDRILDTAIQAVCNGCQVDHPSQHQHDCIMIEDRESRVFYGLRPALKMLNWNEVKQDFFHRVSMSQLLRCGSCFDNVNWWRNLWKEATWEELLIDCLLAEEK